MSPRTPDRATPFGHYSAQEVARLAGVSPSRIGAWARYGIIPSRHHSRRYYTYADAGEAVLAHYLVEQGLKSREVRQIVGNLRDQFGEWPLATAPLEHEGRLVVMRANGDIYYDVLRQRQEVISGTIMDLRKVRDALNQGGWVALEEPREYIEVNPNRLSGRPTIRGRRIGTDVVAELASYDAGLDVLFEDFDLTREQIDAAVDYERDVEEALAA